MTPSERLKIIKEISRKLSQEEWRYVNVVLRQFNIQTMNPDDYYDGLFEYVADMVEEAPDQTLIELAQHLEIPLSDTPSSIPTPEFWGKEKFKLFLSHISSFKKETAELQEELSAYGVSAFVAHEDIEPTKEWQNEIEKALKTMDGLAALLTDKFHESRWTDQEVGVAIGRCVPVIAVRFGLDPYGFIGKYQGLQGLGKHMSKLAEEIVKILFANPNSQQQMINALVHSLGNSESFAQSKKIIELIESAPYLTDEQIKLLEKAVKENRQVRESFGVPDIVKSLKKKFIG